MSRPCTPCGRDRGTFPNVAGPARPPTCHPRDAGAAAIGHADRPDQVERKTTEYPSRERGVKAGPGWPGPVCTQSAVRPHAWQEGTPARRSPPPARRYPYSPSLYYRTQAGFPGSGGDGLSSWLVQHDVQLVHSVRVTVEGRRRTTGRPAGLARRRRRHRRQRRPDSVGGRRRGRAPDRVPALGRTGRDTAPARPHRASLPCRHTGAVTVTPFTTSATAQRGRQRRGRGVTPHRAGCAPWTPSHADA